MIAEQLDWTEVAEAGQLKEAIVKYIRAYDYVTFVELQHRLEGYFDVKGSWVIGIEPGVIVWLGMSETFSKAVMELEREKRIFYHPTVLLTYLCDGGLLQMPIAKRLPKQGYKKDHWLPVCLRTVPPKKR